MADRKSTRPLMQPPKADDGQGTIDTMQARAQNIAGKKINDRSDEEQAFLNHVRNFFGYDPARTKSYRGGDAAATPNHRPM